MTIDPSPTPTVAHGSDGSWFTAEVVLRDGEPVVVAEGELDICTSAALLAAADAAATGRDPLVFDMAKVSFCDSAGLAALLDCRRARGADDRVVVLRTPSPQLLRLLAMTATTGEFLIEHR